MPLNVLYVCLFSSFFVYMPRLLHHPYAPCELFIDAHIHTNCFIYIILCSFCFVSWLWSCARCISTNIPPWTDYLHMALSF
jgi:hypothetical protein